MAARAENCVRGPRGSRGAMVTNSERGGVGGLAADPGRWLSEQGVTAPVDLCHAFTSWDEAVQVAGEAVAVLCVLVRKSNVRLPPT